MNHCLLEVEVLEAPQVRYTQDQTAIAEMLVSLEGLRPDDPPGQLKVVGWGNLATELPNRVQVGQRLLIEGRLRMNTVTRQDGVKEKKAEFTLGRLHPIGSGATAGGATAGGAPMAPAQPAMATASAKPASAKPQPRSNPAAAAAASKTTAEPVPTWNAAPLVPDLGDDDIPF